MVVQQRTNEDRRAHGAGRGQRVRGGYGCLREPAGMWPSGWRWASVSDRRRSLKSPSAFRGRGRGIRLCCQSHAMLGLPRDSCSYSRAASDGVWIPLVALRTNNPSQTMRNSSSENRCTISGDTCEIRGSPLEADFRDHAAGPPPNAPATSRTISWQLAIQILHSWRSSLDGSIRAARRQGNMLRMCGDQICRRSN